MVRIGSTLMLLAIGSLSSSHALAGGKQNTNSSPKPMIYKWQPVAGAAYYRGRYVYHGGAVAFRTSSNWIMLRAVNAIDVKAISNKGTLLKTMPVSASSPRHHLGGESPHSSESAEQGVVSELASGKDWDPLSDDDSNLVMEAKFGRRIAHPGRFQFSIHLATGRENLGAQAGIDSYNGSANIGSTATWLEWQPANALWYVAATAEAHNLETTATGSDASGTRFLRATGRTFLFYDVAGSSSREVGSLGVGLGVEHTRLPVMGITDRDKGSATLRLQTATGPAIGMEVTGRLGERAAVIGLLSYQPTTFTANPKALSAMADTTFRWHLSKTWFVDAAGAWHWYRMSSEQSCATVECQNFSQSTSTVFMLSGGTGVNF